MNPDTIVILQAMKAHFALTEALTCKLDKIEETLSRIEDTCSFALDDDDDELDLEYVDSESDSDLSVQSAPF